MNAPLTLGLTLPPYLQPDELRSIAAAADDSALHSLWVTDRTVVDMPWMETLTVLSALAVATSRVQIGSSVLVLPRRNPVLLAQALATIDHLSKGRLIVGIGVGDPRLTGPAELDLAVVDPATRGRLTDEYLVLLERLWAGEKVSYDSPTCRVEDAALGLRPTGDVPVWIGGSSPAACQRAGRFGDGWLATMTTPQAYRSQLASTRLAAEQHGREAAGITPALYLFGAIDQDGSTSAQVLDGVLRGFLGAPLEAVSDSCIWGTPQQWRERIAMWQAAGVEHINVALFGTDLVGDVRLIDTQVLDSLEPAAG